MPNYDISNLPPPVQEALLHLTERLVETWTPSPGEPVPMLPSLPEIAAGAPWPPALEGSAEQDTLEQAFPRSAVELRILALLRTLYPLSVTTYQLASVLGKPRGETREFCHALFTLNIIAHTGFGHYRYRPSPTAERTP